MSKSPYSVRIKQNTDQKKLRIWTSLTQWYTYAWSLSRVQNNVQFDVYNVFQTIYVICGVRSFENVATFHLLKVIFICKQVHYIMVIFYEFIILIYYNCEFIFYNYWDMTPVINADRYKSSGKKIKTKLKLIENEKCSNTKEKDDPKKRIERLLYKVDSTHTSTNNSSSWSSTFENNLTK